MTIETVKQIESNIDMFLKLYDNAIHKGNDKRATELVKLIDYELNKLEKNEVQLYLN